MKICEHYANIKREKLANSIRSAQKTCSKRLPPHNQDKDALWLCLSCAYVGCSRNSDSKCAMLHYNQSKHRLAMSISTGQIFCYECDQMYEYLIQDIQEEGELKGSQHTRFEKMKEFKELVESYFLLATEKPREEKQTLSSGKFNGKTTVVYNPQGPSKNQMEIERQKQQQKGSSSEEEERRKARNSNNQSKIIITAPISNQNSKARNNASTNSTKLNVFGLSNLGNTCFFNSTMQSLYATRALHEVYSQIDFSDSLDESDASKFVQQLYDKIDPEELDSKEIPKRNVGTVINQRFKKFLFNTATVHTFTPSEVFGAVCAAKSKFKSMAQQDAQELLRYLMQAMIEGEITYLGINRQTLRVVERKFGKLQITPLEKLFGCHLASRLHCLNCGLVSWTLDLCLDLSIEIVRDKPSYIEVPFDTPIPQSQIKEPGLRYPPQQAKVHKLLAAFFAPQTLGRNNYYHCEQCKASKAIKKLYLKSGPQVLTIVIKRFTNGLTKNNADVDFPEILDLAGVCLTPGALCSYKLYAVVVHQGSVRGGHYVAYTRRDEQWFYFSDSHTKRTSWESVSGCQAYILFYEKML